MLILETDYRIYRKSLYGNLSYCISSKDMSGPCVDLIIELVKCPYYKEFVSYLYKGFEFLPTEFVERINSTVNKDIFLINSMGLYFLPLFSVLSNYFSKGYKYFPVDLHNNLEFYKPVKGLSLVSICHNDEAHILITTNLDKGYYPERGKFEFGYGDHEISKQWNYDFWVLLKIALEYQSTVSKNCEIQKFLTSLSVSFLENL